MLWGGYQQTKVALVELGSTRPGTGCYCRMKVPPAASSPAPEPGTIPESSARPTLYQCNCSCPPACTGRTVLAKTKSRTLLITMTLCRAQGSLWLPSSLEHRQRLFQLQTLLMHLQQASQLYYSICAWSLIERAVEVIQMTPGTMRTLRTPGLTSTNQPCPMLG